MVAQSPPGVVAYTHAPDGKPPWPVLDIYTVRADGSGQKALTSDGHSHHPVWSPDGRRLLFIHDAALQTKAPYKETPGFETHHAVELSVMDADGRNRRVLRVIEPVIYKAVWSPDGKMLAINAGTSQSPGEPAKVGVYLLDASGQGELRLLVPNAWSPSWSPDGKKLAFTVEGPRGQWSIHVANADGTDSVRLTGPSTGNGSAAWSPDGQQLVFQRDTEPGSHQIFVMNADGSNLRKLTKDPAWACGASAWASGGDHIVMGCRSADQSCGMGVYSTGHPMPECTRRLFLLDVRTPNAKPVRITDHDAALPSYRPK